MKRNFLKKDIKLETWADIEPYFEDLANREISSEQELINWWQNRSETESFIEENAAWRYIKMSCDTENEKLSESYNYYVSEIDPKISEYTDKLDNKLISSEFVSALEKGKYFVPLRSVKKNIEIFRKENIPILSELQKEERLYGSIAAKMTIHYKGEEITLQKAGNLLRQTDRELRKEIYELINNRRIQDSEELNKLLTSLIEKRDTAAKNAGFKNYRDFKFVQLHRFDYDLKSCFDFHEAVKTKVCPLADRILERHKQKLSYTSLKPYDTEVDSELKPPLNPFQTSEELLDKSIKVFTEIRPKYGDYLQKMKDGSFLDLASRKGKAPGGYNYPLYESNIPFIFMNATGNLRDVETLMHEGGHAIHSFLSADLELVDFKNVPSEVAELASMSMELISMEHWETFFPDKEELKRAKRTQLEGLISILPWVATVDKFQHRLYENPAHSVEERYKMWQEVSSEFHSKIIDYTDYENFAKNTWQKQLHIFEVPFYYIEYGFAQLGAIAVWKNYKKNPGKALNDYENCLKAGYSITIPELYQKAGIEFNFSKEYIGELMDFVKEELEKLY